MFKNNLEKYLDFFEKIWNFQNMAVVVAVRMREVDPSQIVNPV